MSEAPSLSQSKEEGVELTPAFIADVLYNSFFYSQGNQLFQQEIFSYLVATHPEWRWPQCSFKALMPVFVRMHRERFDAFVASPAHIDVDMSPNSTRRLVSEAMQTEFKDFRAAVCAPRHDPQELLANLVSHMVTRDAYYWEQPEGRPRTGRVRTGIAHPRASHTVRFLIERRRGPGGPLFDEMLQAMSDELRKRMSVPDDLLRPYVEQLIATHNAAVLRKGEPPVDLDRFVHGV
jgi:hypothetical protein